LTTAVQIKNINGTAKICDVLNDINFNRSQITLVYKYRYNNVMIHLHKSLLYNTTTQHCVIYKDHFYNADFAVGLITP